MLCIHKEALLVIRSCAVKWSLTHNCRSRDFFVNLSQLVVEVEDHSRRSYTVGCVDKNLQATCQVSENMQCLSLGHDEVVTITFVFKYEGFGLDVGFISGLRGSIECHDLSFFARNCIVAIMREWGQRSVVGSESWEVFTSCCATLTILKQADFQVMLSSTDADVFFLQAWH